MNLNDMKPAELRAAMKGGTTAWGVIGSAAEHVRYKLALPKIRARRQCHCGCGTKATHAKMWAETTPEYARKREAHDTRELVVELTRSLKYYLRSLEHEIEMSR